VRGVVSGPGLGPTGQSDALRRGPRRARIRRQDLVRPRLSLSRGGRRGRGDESNADVLRPNFEDWLGDVGVCQPFVACLHDGAAVSLCCSVRETAQAHEAGVETAPAFRRRGSATHVVAAWADAVRGMDRIPLYSTSWKNTASQRVANKLGLIRFGNDLHIT
jgi:RimJ/RimL family protein N-acetyltransferase